MSRFKTVLLAVAALTGLAATSSCSPSAGAASRSLAQGKQIAGRIIGAPYGYSRDQTPGASGSMTADLFTRIGGVGRADRSGFVAGFRQTYVNHETREGLAITVIEFRSPGQASDYLRATSAQTLSYSAPTIAPFDAIPGALRVDGTKEYAGEYLHAVIASKGHYYLSVIYASTGPQAPLELVPWAQHQDSRL